MSGHPQGLQCPLCRRLPVLIIGEQQALCGNPDCKTFMWDPTATLDELMKDIGFIDLGPLA